MKRFSKKSVAFFFLTIALCGFFSFGVVKAQPAPTTSTASTPPVAPTYISPISHITYTYQGNGGGWSTPGSPNIPDSQFFTSANPETTAVTTSGVPISMAENTYDTAEAAYVAAHGTVAGNTLGLLGGLASFPLATGFLTFFSVIYAILSAVLTIAGYLLDMGITMSLFHMGLFFTTTANNPSLASVWQLVRDTANVTFIFILLYIAITMIIGSFTGKAKATLTGVIVSALFINFSMFFAEVIIDAGNIVAVALFNKIPNLTALGGAATGSSPNMGASISGVIMNGFTANVNGTSIFHFISNSNVQVNAVITIILVDIAIGIACYVLFYAGGIFIGRLVMLVILVVTSPVGFLGGAIPWLDDLRNKWWKTFTDQVVVAPMFMFLMLLFFDMLQILQNTTANLTKASGWSAVNGLDLASYLYYVILIVLLWEGMKLVKEKSGEVGAIANRIGGALTVAGAAVATGGISGVGTLLEKTELAAVSRPVARVSGAMKNVGNTAYKFATGKYENKPGLLGYGGRVARETMTGGLKNLTGGIVTEQTIKEEVGRQKAEMTRKETELGNKIEQLKQPREIVEERAKAATEKTTGLKQESVESELKAAERARDRAKELQKKVNDEVTAVTAAGGVPNAQLLDREARAQERLVEAETDYKDSMDKLTDFMYKFLTNYTDTARKLNVDVSPDTLKKLNARIKGIGTEKNTLVENRLQLLNQIRNTKDLPLFWKGISVLKKGSDLGALTQESREQVAYDLSKDSGKK